MLTKELRNDCWYLYKNKFVVQYLLSHKTFTPVWRFIFLCDSVPQWIDVLEEEVHANIRPVGQVLERYLLLFEAGEKDYGEEW